MSNTTSVSFRGFFQGIPGSAPHLGEHKDPSWSLKDPVRARSTHAVGPPRPFIFRRPMAKPQGERRPGRRYEVAAVSSGSAQSNIDGVTAVLSATRRILVGPGSPRSLRPGHDTSEIPRPPDQSLTTGLGPVGGWRPAAGASSKGAKSGPAERPRIRTASESGRRFRRCPHSAMPWRIWPGGRCQNRRQPGHSAWSIPTVAKDGGVDMRPPSSTPGAETSGAPRDSIVQ